MVVGYWQAIYQRESFMDAARRMGCNINATAQKLRDAVKVGLLSRPSVCEHCGVDGRVIEGHHEDYGFPLDVLWLCQSCHRKRHQRADALRYGTKDLLFFRGDPIIPARYLGGFYDVTAARHGVITLVEVPSPFHKPKAS